MLMLHRKITYTCHKEMALQIQFNFLLYSPKFKRDLYIYRAYFEDINTKKNIMLN